MYFEELEKSFLSLQSRLKPEYIIEVGAREAEFSLRAKKLLPHSKIYAFEANPYVHNEYSKRCKRKGVNYLPLGVSNINGRKEFQINLKKEKTDGSHSFLKVLNFEEYESISIDCITLDEFFMPILLETDNIALWIDAEGFSGQILEGATKLLSHVQSLYIEVEHKRFWQDQALSTDIVSLLEARDFKLAGRDLEYFPVQENYLFINPWSAKFV
jgi:FkbM family methyltransferase